MIQMDDNTTQIALALISLFGVIATGIFSFLSLRYASAAKANSAEALTNSKANSETLHVMHEAVNGMTRQRVDAEARVGDAKVAQARAEGRLEEIVRVLPGVAPLPAPAPEPASAPAPEGGQP